MSEELIGKVTHYFGKAGVVGITLSGGELAVGDTIHIVGHTSDFTQKIDSMQVDNVPVQTAQKGDSVGLKVAHRAREHDEVYRVLPD